MAAAHRETSRAQILSRPRDFALIALMRGAFNHSHYTGRQ
jgi:hypothetical protein